MTIQNAGFVFFAENNLIFQENIFSKNDFQKIITSYFDIIYKTTEDREK